MTTSLAAVFIPILFMAGILGRLSRLREALVQAPQWEPAALEPLIRQFAEAEGVGIGKFGPQLRLVLAGGSPAPDLAGTLTALGRDESLGRFDDALSLSV